MVEIQRFDVDGVMLFKPQTFRDERGYFRETFRQNWSPDLPRFVQGNESWSRAGVLRGLHYQLVEPQAKLVRVAQGEVLDVAVDIRRSSPTFGKHVAAKLTEEGGEQLYVPPGFAHGFLALTDARLVYQCSTYYHPQSDRSLLWSDDELGIAWGVSEPDLSGKDAAAPSLADAELFA